MIETGYIAVENGIRLFFQKMGNAPRTVLVPNGVYLFDDFKHLAENRTIVFYDVRNRGRSDTINDPDILKPGIHNDVEDLEAVRRHFGDGPVALIGHSYIASVVALYAMRYPAHADRVIMIGPTPPRAGGHIAYDDGTLGEISARLGRLFKDRRNDDPVGFCRKFWSILKPLYVVNPADAHRIDWDRCDLPNELNFMNYWNAHLLPSIEALDPAPEDFAKATMPVLLIHGAKDRSAP